MTQISDDRGTEPPDGMTSCTPCGISEEILLPTELIRQETEEPQPDTVEGILTQIGVLLKEAVQSTLNNRKRLIVAGVLALVWFGISLLPALGINPIPVQALSFLTFAKKEDLPADSRDFSVVFSAKALLRIWLLLLYWVDLIFQNSDRILPRSSPRSPVSSG